MKLPTCISDGTLATESPPRPASHVLPWPRWGTTVFLLELHRRRFKDSFMSRPVSRTMKCPERYTTIARHSQGLRFFWLSTPRRTGASVQCNAMPPMKYTNFMFQLGWMVTRLVEHRVVTYLSVRFVQVVLLPLSTSSATISRHLPHVLCRQPLCSFILMSLVTTCIGAVLRECCDAMLSRSQEHLKRAGGLMPSGDASKGGEGFCPQVANDQCGGRATSRGSGVELL